MHLPPARDDRTRPGSRCRAPTQPDDPGAEITPTLIVDVLSEVAWHYFPFLAPSPVEKLR
jgi:hypothetical protein